MSWALILSEKNWEDENLNLTEKILLARLQSCAYSSRDNRARISNEQLAKEMDLTPHTISRYIASIEKKGLIKREIVNHNGKTTRLVYIV